MGPGEVVPLSQAEFGIKLLDKRGLFDHDHVFFTEPP